VAALEAEAAAAAARRAKELEQEAIDRANALRQVRELRRAAALPAPVGGPALPVPPCRPLLMLPQSAPSYST